jgi:ABC-type bacteriocin/lantibiotic exporter with double-glycine peptidase domain
MQIFKKLIFILSYQERKSASLLLVMIIIMALLEMIGVASIFPFISVISNPDLIETNYLLNKIFQISNIFGIENNNEFIFFLGLILFITIIISLLFKIVTLYVQVRFTNMCEYNISKRFLQKYINQPYSWFLYRHSAELGKNILSDVHQLVSSGIGPFLELISKGMITIFLIILLLMVNIKITLIVGFSISFTYLLIFYFVKKYLDKIGEKRLLNNHLRFSSVSEVFGALKEVKIGQLEEIYIKKYSNAAYILAITQAYSQLIGQLPRFILEGIVFGGILLIMLYIMNETNSFSAALPVISLFIFAGYRLMPAIQQIYSSFTSLAFIGPTVQKLYHDYKNLHLTNLNQNQEDLQFNNIISLKNIFYEYPNAERIAVKNISLKILAKTRIGIVGTTGSGKTTLVDIILGLLRPTKGKLEVDDKLISNHNIISWQRLIGYVPQQTYLSDDTVAANIAFGVEPKDINQNMVEKVSKVANMHEFIMDELPESYQTIIGERGVRLSGGQRQRISIARALYHNPKLLILDEATSALDNETEKAVMDALNNLSKDITVILIAHRLNTVKKCDTIFKLEKGQLIAQGSFEEVVKSI